MAQRTELGFCIPKAEDFCIEIPASSSDLSLHGSNGIECRVHETREIVVRSRTPFDSVRARTRIGRSSRA